jgi:hypothetical protein
MRKPFVLRVQNDDPGVARELGRALVAPLVERGARVRLDGTLQGTGAHGVVHVMTAARGLKGTSVALGVFDEEHGARWLTPLDVPEGIDDAVPKILAFLEEWGFIGAPLQRAPEARTGSAS